MKKKPTIEQLEKILNSPDEIPIKIMPNGEIRAIKKRKSKPKILTMREASTMQYGY